MEDTSADLQKPRLIDLPKIYDARGSLTFVEDGDGRLPFDIKRVFWVYDVPSGAVRGSHANKVSRQLIVAVSGCFDVVLFDGHQTQVFTLNRPYQGLYVPPGYWRTLDNFVTGSVCMILTSTLYDPDDYERDYNEFAAKHS